jgi:5-methylcytosine-specific restriction endonuclease McrA
MSQARCQLCGRDVPLTRHHLIPRACHRRGWFQRRYSREQLNRCIPLCRLCHSGIHDLIPNEQQLGKQYPTLEQLLSHDGVQRMLAWVRKQK